MKIVFDLDGVLRDLCGYLNEKLDVPYPKEWIWKHHNKDIFEWIKEDRYCALVYAPITEYFSIVHKTIKNIELWTCQPEKWRPYTKLWINTNIGDCTIHYLDTNQKREKLDKEPNTYLVEDSPNFKHYDRILLIDRPYNRKVSAETRIHNPKELKQWLIKHEDNK